MYPKTNTKIVLREYKFMHVDNSTTEHIIHKSSVYT